MTTQTETPADVTIDAARSAITLLNCVIDDAREGKEPILTLQEIGQALIGTPSPPTDSDDLLTLRLQKSVQATCKHERRECLSTSESGSNTTWARFWCRECGHAFTDELLPAEYEKLLKEIV